MINNEMLENKISKKHSKIIAVSIIYIISALLYLFVRIGGKFGIFNFFGESKGYVLNLVNQLLFIGGVPIIFYMLFEKKNLKGAIHDFKFKKIPAKIVGVSFLMGVALFGIVLYLSSAWGGLVDLTGYKTPLFSAQAVSVADAWKNFGVGTVFTCILPAFCEEILLRGCLLAGYENMGRRKAIIFVGLLFGFLHVNIYQTFYASVMGMLLCIFTMMTGSIWPAIIMHFTSNFCSVFTTFIESLNLFGGNLNKFFYTIFSGNIISSIVNYVLFGIIILTVFIRLFVEILKYSKSKMLYDKLSKIMSDGGLKVGEKIEINDETSQSLIDMKNLVQNELLSNFSPQRKTLDFVIPPTEKDSYKLTKLEWFFVILALAITGGATLASFIGGLF